MEMNKSLNLRQDLNKIIGKRLRELRPIIASEEIEIMHLSSAALIINPPQLWSVHFNAFYNPVKFFSIAHCVPKMDLCSELHCVVALVALMEQHLPTLSFQTAINTPSVDNVDMCYFATCR